MPPCRWNCAVNAVNRRATKTLDQRRSLHSIPMAVARHQCKSQGSPAGALHAGNVSSPKYNYYPIIVAQSALRLAALKVGVRRIGKAHSSLPVHRARHSVALGLILPLTEGGVKLRLGGRPGAPAVPQGDTYGR